MAPIVLLLKTVFESILEVFLLCLAGYLLARRGILDKKTQKQLNRLNVSLFTPSLLFSKVAFFLSPAKLRELWAIPIFFVIVTLCSMSIAYVLGWIFRLKRSQRSFAVAAAMFMNSNSLPIALMQSLVVTVPGLKWDDDDDRSSMLGRALTYLVLYSTLGMVLRWSYGVHLLSQADPETQQAPPQEEEEDLQADEADETSPLLGSDETVAVNEVPYLQTPEGSEPSTLRERPSSVSFAEHDASREFLSASQNQTAAAPDYGSINRGDGSPDSRSVRSDKGKHDRFFYSFPNTPARSTAKLPHVPSEVSVEGLPEDGADDDFLPSISSRLRHRKFTSPTSSRFRSYMRRTRRRAKKIWRTINEFMTVPLWAAAASLVVALIPPLQHTIDAHVKFIKGALSAAGDCSIPLTLVVLGAYFFIPPPSEEDMKTTKDQAVLPSTVTSGTGNMEGNIVHEDGSMRREENRTSFVGSIRSMFSLHSRDNKGLFSGKSSAKTSTARPGETRTVMIAVVARMVLTPLLLLPVMALSAKYNYPKVFDDPVFVVSNVLLISSPPALTLAQITQAASGDAFERLISRTIFWAYCVVTPPATIIYVVIGLLLAKL